MAAAGDRGALLTLRCFGADAAELAPPILPQKPEMQSTIFQRARAPRFDSEVGRGIESARGRVAPSFPAEDMVKPQGLQADGRDGMRRNHSDGTIDLF